MTRPRKQLIRNLVAILDKNNSTHIRISDDMTDEDIKRRIEAIRLWDTLSSFECPMCGTSSIKLDSQADRGLNLKCAKCGIHYVMSLSRSLGAFVVERF